MEGQIRWNALGCARSDSAMNVLLRTGRLLFISHKAILPLMSNTPTIYQNVIAVIRGNIYVPQEQRPLGAETPLGEARGHGL